MSVPSAFRAADAAVQPAAAIKPRNVPSAVSADLLALPGPGPSRMILVLVGLVASFILWSAFASVAEVTTGRGRIIPASKIQVVQNLEGGIVREILVHEGALVREGDVLLRIDPTIAGSSLGEAREKISGLMALIARLEAEVEQKPLTFPPEVTEKRPDLAGHQREHFETRRRELEAALGGLTLQEQQRAQEILETQSRIVTLRLTSNARLFARSHDCITEISTPSLVNTCASIVATDEMIRDGILLLTTSMGCNSQKPFVCVTRVVPFQ